MEMSVLTFKKSVSADVGPRTLLRLIIRSLALGRLGLQVVLVLVKTCGLVTVNR